MIASKSWVSRSYRLSTMVLDGPPGRWRYDDFLKAGLTLTFSPDEREPPVESVTFWRQWGRDRISGRVARSELPASRPRRARNAPTSGPHRELPRPFLSPDCWRELRGAHRRGRKPLCILRSCHNSELVERSSTPGLSRSQKKTPSCPSPLNREMVALDHRAEIRDFPIRTNIFRHVVGARLAHCDCRQLLDHDEPPGQYSRIGPNCEKKGALRPKAERPYRQGQENERRQYSAIGRL
jgi:hypothetical protein